MLRMYRMDVVEALRHSENAFDKLFSTEMRFSEHLYKQSDAELSDMYDHNAFVTDGMPSVAEIEAARSFQKENGSDFLKINSKIKLDSDILKLFGLAEDRTDTMVLEEGRSNTWKRNPRVVIKDLKHDDIADDIVSVELQTYGEDYGVDFVKRKMRRYLAVSNNDDRFHYFGAYINGKIAGACYAFDSDGYVCIDGLAVNEPFRRQYVATTLLAHIAEIFGERLYLHADAEDTPKVMYQRMGFYTVDTCFEYNYDDTYET